MASKTTWVRDEVIKYLASLGIKGMPEHGHKHDRVIWEVNGRQMYKSCSRSPSDSAFSARRAVGDVKKLLREAGYGA
jgi:hypothetical protein